MRGLLRRLGAYGRVRTLAKTMALGAFVALPAAAQDDGVTIAAMGDSLTQGYGLVQDQGFVPQLQAWLDARGANAEIVNAGVSGDTSAGGLSRIDWTLTPQVDGLIVALGGNDLLRGIDPAVTRENLDGILSRAEASDVPVLLVGLSAPGNYGPDYQRDFEAIFPSLAEEYGALLEESFLAALEAAGPTGEAARRYMQADGIHPNSEGVALIVEDLGPRVLELVDRARGA